MLPSLLRRRASDTRAAVVVDTCERFAGAMLARISIYGTLELPSDEMPQLLGELDQLARAAGTAPTREVLEAVRRLADACRDDRCPALRFVATDRLPAWLRAWVHGGRGDLPVSDGGRCGRADQVRVAAGWTPGARGGTFLVTSVLI